MNPKCNASTDTSLAQELSLIQAKLYMAGNFSVLLLCLVALFTFVLKDLTEFVHDAGTAFHLTTSTMFLLLIVFALAAKKTGYPARFYGFTLVQWQRAVIEAILFTLPVLLMMVVMKWIAIHFDADYSTLKLFALGHGVVRLKAPTETTKLVMLCFYIFVSSPIQEVIFRGGIQGTLQFFLINRHKLILANVTASILFAVLHVVLSLRLAGLALICGLFWGWLYQRHKTLIGVIIAHITMGVWAFFILGIQDIIFS